jgi:hypothetical protein
VKSLWKKGVRSVGSEWEGKVVKASEALYAPGTVIEVRHVEIKRKWASNV